MTSSNSPILRACTLAVAASVLPAACQAGDWRQGLVRGIVSRSAVDPAVNLACAPASPDQPAAKVVVVSYRVGKSHQWRAFNLATDDSYAVGDEVIANLADCRLARLPRAADTAASAP
jgi:hypothetical protein